jgi:phosphoribosyl 1,2-cyclic phosphodiesterase
MLELISLISGSSGNSSLITDGKTNILIDCGTSGKRLCELLEKAGIPPQALSAVLITHEHIDHTKGAGIISRKLNLPVYASRGTHLAMNIGPVSENNIVFVEPDAEFEINDILITPFLIPHDASEPCGFCFTDGKEKAAIATDIGVMSASLFSRISGSRQIILESNHDVDMLRFGEYPYPLKQRILSDVGHLSNTAAAQTALRLVECGTEQIMLGHLSDKNNLPEIAMMETYNLLSDNGIAVGKDVTLQVAERYDITKFI